MEIYVGFWNEKHKPQLFINKPHPQSHEIIKFLQGGKIKNRYKGFAECRICGERLGNSDRTDKGYVWPSQLEHYVSEHQLWLYEFDVILMGQKEII